MHKASRNKHAIYRKTSRLHRDHDDRVIKSRTFGVHISTQNTKTIKVMKDTMFTNISINHPRFLAVQWMYLATNFLFEIKCLLTFPASSSFSKNSYFYIFSSGHTVHVFISQWIKCVCLHTWSKLLKGITLVWL